MGVYKFRKKDKKNKRRKLFKIINNTFIINLNSQNMLVYMIELDQTNVNE